MLGGYLHHQVERAGSGYQNPPRTYPKLGPISRTGQESELGLGLSFGSRLELGLGLGFGISQESEPGCLGLSL